MKMRILFPFWISMIVFVLLLTSVTPAGSQVSPAIQFSSQEKGLGPEYQISISSNPETNRFVPASAFNSTNRQTLVVWHRNNGNNLYYIEGRLLNPAGAPLGSGPTILIQGQTPVYQPAVAYNSYDNQYLLVWMNNPSLDGKTYAIWGMILNANLTVAHPEFEIFTPLVNYSAWTPRVAFNQKNTEYQVVWNNYNITGYPNIYPDSIIEETVTYDGYLVGHIVVIFNSPGNMIYPNDVDLVFANNNGELGQFLWVWDQVKPGTADHDIWAANIDAKLGGYIPSLPPFKIDDSPTDQVFPSIATNGNDRFLVVWQEKSTNQWQDWDVRGREINQLGVTFGGLHIIAGQGDTDEMAPFVIAYPGNTSRYVVGYERESPTGQGIWLAYYDNGVNALPIDPYIFWLDYFPAAEYGFWINSYPTGVVTGPTVQLAYQGVSNTPVDHTQIYSRTWSPARSFIPSIKK